MTWTVAGVQMDCHLGDKARNLDAMRARLRDAAGLGAKLIVFPECCLTGYSFDSKAEAMQFAEPVPGPACNLFREECRTLGVWTIFGMLEASGDLLFNVCVLVGPDGLVGSYRKIHLPFLGVDRFTTPGDRPFAIHELDGLRVGMSICYDGGFPETSRVLALLGADLIVLPTNWPEGARNAADLLVRARSLENAVYGLAVNRIGEEGGFHFIGQTQLVGCDGNRIAHADHDRDGMIIGNIEPERARQKRVVFVPGKYEIDRVGHRRPEMYGPIAEGKSS